MRASTRADTWLVGVALISCLAVVAGILVALVASAPGPSLAAVALIALVAGAGAADVLAARALLRPPRHGNRRR